MRTALGADRGRLLRQMLTESLMLSLAGGVAGLALAVVFHRGLLALVADRIPVPRLDQVTLDLPVVAFTVAIAVATGLLFGLIPALLASAMANDALREGGRHGAGPRSRRTLNALIVVEVALSLVLLTGAGLLIRSFIRLQNVDPGFRSEQVFTARVSLPGARYPQPRDSAAFFEAAVSRIRELPGVQSAAGTAFLPMSGAIGTRFYRLDRPVPADGQAPSTQVRPVTPDFFRTMGMPLRAGRDFTGADRDGAPAVAIVSEGVVRQLYPGEDPLGKRLQVNARGPKGQQVEIVGVVADARLSSLDSETRVAVYLPNAQLSIGLMTFVARTAVPPLSLVEQRCGHRAQDRSRGAARRRQDHGAGGRVRRWPARGRVSVLLTAFALIALLLAAVGVYGVMSYSVSQRTREIGVRMALGATAESVFRMVLGQALRLVAAGTVAGLIAAALLTRLLETLLFQTEALDLLTFAATAVVLVSVATLASFIPARRGTRITPIEALRAE